MIAKVIKIGGAVIDDTLALDAFLTDFAAIEGPKILVHGGGRAATALSKKLGIETKMVDGRRITDRETLDVVLMTYAGLINKQIVAALQAKGCNAIGLTGADANCIPATRRSPVPIDFGYVGDISAADINVKFLESLMQQGIAPVFCALTHDGKGDMLNSNADSVAAALAVAMSSAMATEIIYCFEQPGVMADINDSGSVIPLITAESYQQLKADGVVCGGMIPKIDNAFAAISQGVGAVVIRPAQELSRECGTKITE